MKKIIFALFILSFISCLKEKKEITTNITEVENIGLKIQKSLSEFEIGDIDDFYDIRSLADRFLLKTSNKKTIQFNTGFFASFSSQFSFGQILVNEVEKGSSYEFIRAYQDKNKDFHLLFRLYGDGLNYHDHLVKLVNGKPKIVDTYIYLTGENLSETFKMLYKGLLYNNGIFNKDIEDIRAFKDMNKLKEIKEYNALGEYEKAYDTYNTISNTSKQTRLYKIINIMTSSNLSEKIYQKAIKDYEDKFPNDPSLYLISFDGYVIKKEYEKCFSNINKLDKTLKDPFLNYLRGNVFYLKKDNIKALEMFNLVKNEYPDFIDVYDSLLSIYIETDKKQNSIEILNLLVSKFEVDKKDITDSLKENYKNFTKTKEFKNWLKENQNV